MTAPFRGAEARLNRLDPEARMTIKTLAARGATNSHIARLLGVTEGAVRHHIARLQAGALDGRSRQEPKAACVAAAIDHWRQMQEEGPINLAVLHAWLMSEHGGIVRNFVCGSGMMGGKEPNHAKTQRASYS